MRLLDVWVFLCILQSELFSFCDAIAAQVNHNSSWQPQYVLVATAETISQNCNTRRSVVFNGTFPGPTIYLREDKTTWVRVYNRIPDKNLTVHWHGLTMRTAPFSDGTPLVTQWPIPYDNFFDYEMRPDIGDAGTYTYHSHEGFQAMTAHGHLVVQDAADPPYQYTEEEQVIIADWYTKSDEEIESALTSTNFKWPGGPEALILNGKSGTKSSLDGSDDSCGPSIIEVKPETTYRLRWTSMTALAYSIIEIDDHTDMTVIEADGRYTKPAKIERMQLASGQRFSTLITTKSLSELEADGKAGQYWINYRTPDGPNGVLSGKALLRYNTGSNSAESKRSVGHGKPSGPGSHPGSGSGSGPGSGPQTGSGPGNSHQHGRPTAPGHENIPGKPEVSVDDSYTTWLEYALEPLDEADYFPPLAEVTRTIQINLTMDKNTEGLWKFQMNNLSWDETTFKARPGAVPYLIDAYVNGKTPDYDAAMANYGWDPNSLGFPVQIGEVIDIVWQQTNIGARRNYDYHPMHAHGERYWDLGSGSGEYDPVANEQRFEGYHPPQRDTTVLYSYGDSQEGSRSAWRAWRIKVTKENAGAWIMHCHILHHMVMGMQTIWVFGDATTILDTLPQPYIAGYLEYGGSAYGNDSYDPLVLSYFGD